MSKWNHMKTIPIYSLTDEERKEAIKEWAEGNEHLEKLLWNCYNNGIETAGCHYGRSSYFQIHVNDSNDAVRRMLYKAKEIPKVQVLAVMEGHNPRSGPTWYEPSLSFGTFSIAEADQDTLFNTLNDAIEHKDEITPPKEDAFGTMLDIHEFFKNKGSSLMFRVRKDAEGKFKFTTELWGRKGIEEYCDNLFKKAGMKKSEEESHLPEWVIEADDYEELSKKMTHFRDVVLDGWNLEAPTEITDDMTPGEKALIKRKEYGDSEEGQRKLIKYYESQIPKTPLSISIKRRTAYLKRRIYSKTMRFARRVLGLYDDKKKVSNERRGEER